MNVEQTMDALKDLGHEGTRNIYIRHGAGENQFGVKFSDLGKLAKRIKTDTNLARGLWATGNTDARTLATMIADPFELTVQEIETWIRGISYHGLADMVVRNVVSKRADAGAFLARWIEDPAEYVAQSGWDLVASVAMSDAERPDAEFLAFLARIQREIHTSPNRVRHTMNSALIAIGLRNERLLAAAKAAAARIGRVHVDHGETGCKTPDAPSYMDKALAYRNKKAKA